MKKLFNSFLLSLTICFAIPGNCHSYNYPLSYESKRFIAICALTGGAIGGLFGAAASADATKKLKQDADFWTKVSAYCGPLLVGATIGATIGGAVSYFFTSEAYLNSAQKEMDALETDLMFKRAVDNADVQALKKLTFNACFPSIVIYEKLNAFHGRLKTIKDYLLTVINSGISPIVSIARAALARIEEYESTIVEKIVNLKDDPRYLKESLARAEMRTMESIAYSQSQIAAAQHRMATAAYMQATRPPVIPIITIHK